MVVIGLTGGIGMGKSVVARQLASLGAKVCSADAIVHMLLRASPSVIKEIKHSFPSAVRDGQVDRKILGEIVFGDEAKRKRLEEILHPRVVAAEEAFIAKARRKGARAVVLEIPLLFETGAQKRCHIVVLVKAPAFLQKQRVMRRKNMTEEKFRGIVNAQMPQREKERRTDVIAQTGLGRAHSFKSIHFLMRMLNAA